MHELNICLNILTLLEKEAKKRKITRIKTVWLEIGDLAGIELDTLKFSFPIATANTLAKEAVLKIISVAGLAWCKDCQKHVKLRNYYDPCLYCNHFNYEIRQGKELRILKMEVG